MSAVPADGLVAQWLLGRALREAREAVRLTQGQMAGELEWSLSKVTRLEAGRSGMTVTDLRAFLARCGVRDEAEAGRLAGLARAGRRRPWHSGHDVVAGDDVARLYLSCESSAAAVTGHRSRIVPALFQTSDYARAFLEGVGEPRAKQVAALVEERQARVASAAPVPGRWTLDEACLRRATGGEAVWRHQLQHLRDLITSHEAEIRVIPFEAGVNPDYPGSFTLFELDGPGECLAFLGAAGTEAVRGDPGQVAELRRHADRLAGIALSAADSAQFLSRLAGREAPAAAQQLGFPVPGPGAGTRDPGAPGPRGARRRGPAASRPRTFLPG